MKNISFLVAHLFVWCSLGAQERIAILSYGSLVNRPAHSVTGALLHASPFKPTPITFPISLSLLGNTHRITAVIDIQNGKPKRVWAATSDYHSLDQALQNLAAREGALFIKNIRKYDTQYIFYCRKLHAGQKSAEYERVIDAQWAIHDTDNPVQQLSESIIATMIAWAEHNNYDTLVWVSCPIMSMEQNDLITQLIANSLLLKNAQMYVHLFADGPQTELEHAILAGKEKLVQLLKSKKYGNHGR